MWPVDLASCRRNRSTGSVEENNPASRFINWCRLIITLFQDSDPDLRLMVLDLCRCRKQKSLEIALQKIPTLNKTCDNSVLRRRS